MTDNMPGFMIYTEDLKAFADQLTVEEMGLVVFALLRFFDTGEEITDGMSKLSVSCYRILRNNASRGYARYRKKATAGARGGNVSKTESASSKNKSASSTSESAPVTISQSQTQNETLSISQVVSQSIPTREEVLAYAATKTTTTDPDRFFDYYEARGWELKPGVPVKNWKAVFNVWMKNEGRFKDGNGADQGESGEYSAPGQGIPYIGV